MPLSDPFSSRPAKAPLRRRCAMALCLAVAGLGAGCAVFRSPPPPPPPPIEVPVPVTVYVPTVEPADQAARHLLAYQETLGKLPPAELSREIGRLGDGSGSLEATMDLALALGFTRVNGDLARAQGLLDQILGNPSAEAQAWYGLARLLSARYAEQRRAEELAERANQQLREAQRDNQRKLDQLNEKLEALKSIERSLNSRPAPGPGPTAPSPAQAPQASAAKPGAPKP